MSLTHLLTTNERIDAVLFLNGTLPERPLLESFASVPFIAADGAANALVEMGIVPDILCGDLDSVHDHVLEAVQAHGTVIVDPNQDDNDFEKALRVASNALWNTVLIIGIHGGELEHTLNNWSVLMRHGRTMRLFVLDGHRIGIPVYERFTYAALPEEVISIIPQPRVRLSTDGLQWELRDEYLELGMREGARNRAVQPDVAITVHEGSALVVVSARLHL